MFNKLFGRSLRKHNKPTAMYDFAQHGLLRSSGDHMGMIAFQSDSDMEERSKKKKKKEKPTVNPKKLFELESLNDNKFSINTDAAYLTKQIKNADKKIGLIYENRTKSENEGPRDYLRGSDYGKLELKSLKVRLENRRRIDEFSEILEEYPHTTSALVNDVIKEYSNLRCQVVGEFVPDMPEEAVEAMTQYNEMCQELTGLDTHFYIIADKEDFGIKDRARDPILLAQSPFGFFWQILGAWDEEMIHLGDL